MEPTRSAVAPRDGLERDARRRLARGGMRSDGELSNEAMNRILRELDLEESRLEI
jgi:hypothetical protein